ncbi:rCG41514 [Rattus norvegicus]|uniref:RCG41514 n=1 Tax=Rattus norvegicus TaxID=10116 RepID=A6IHT9_RAT|nr:rCG41514 [Rattus norvegicus]
MNHGHSGVRDLWRFTHSYCWIVDSILVLLNLSKPGVNMKHFCFGTEQRTWLVGQLNAWNSPASKPEPPALIYL